MLEVRPTSRSVVQPQQLDVAAARVWNSLPDFVTASTSLPMFKRHLKTVLFAKSYWTLAVSDDLNTFHRTSFYWRLILFGILAVVLALCFTNELTNFNKWPKQAAHIALPPYFRKFRRGCSIVEAIYQRSSRKVDAQSVINWTVVDQLISWQYIRAPTLDCYNFTLQGTVVMPSLPIRTTSDTTRRSFFTYAQLVCQFYLAHGTRQY